MTLALLPPACESPEAPSLRTRTIEESVSPPPGFPLAGGFQIYDVTPTRPGRLTATLAWTGDGGLWLDVFDQRPPTTAEPIVSSQRSGIGGNPTILSADVVSRTYFVLVSQRVVPAGPNRGGCGCTNDFVLTLTYP